MIRRNLWGFVIFGGTCLVLLSGTLDGSSFAETAPALSQQIHTPKEQGTARAVEALFPEGEQPEKAAEPREQSGALPEIKKSLQQYEQRLQVVEERLGPTVRRPSLSTSFERRLEDLEKRMNRIERSLDSLEQRIRKLEMKR